MKIKKRLPTATRWWEGWVGGIRFGFGEQHEGAGSRQLTCVWRGRAGGWGGAVGRGNRHAVAGRGRAQGWSVPTHPPTLESTTAACSPSKRPTHLSTLTPPKQNTRSPTPTHPTSSRRQPCALPGGGPPTSAHFTPAKNNAHPTPNCPPTTRSPSRLASRHPKNSPTHPPSSRRRRRARPESGPPSAGRRPAPP